MQPATYFYISLMHCSRWRLGMAPTSSPGGLFPHSVLAGTKGQASDSRRLPTPLFSRATLPFPDRFRGKREQGGLIFRARRLFYPSTLGRA